MICNQYCGFQLSWNVQLGKNLLDKPYSKPHQSRRVLVVLWSVYLPLFRTNVRGASHQLFAANSKHAKYVVQTGDKHINVTCFSHLFQPPNA